MRSCMNSLITARPHRAPAVQKAPKTQPVGVLPTRWDMWHHHRFTSTILFLRSRKAKILIDAEDR